MKPIFVTRPFIPPIQEYQDYIQQILESNHLTNQGPFHLKLEEMLCDYLDVKYISLFSNATIALMVAQKALKICGEIITTPYSFVATSNSIIWSGSKPVFVDIDRCTLSLNINSIRKKINKNTVAIMPVHCYGIPSSIIEIQKLADEYNLKVIYDACHAFGVKFNDKSILSYGDLSVISFHATKIFSTIEGGAIICPNKKLKDEVDSLKNFGFISEIDTDEIGINGKMSEISAAFGVAQLNHINEIFSSRKRIANSYFEGLINISGITMPLYHLKDIVNFSYFPILIESNFPVDRDFIYNHLKDLGIHTRRYFFPLIPDMSSYRKIGFTSEQFEVASDVSNKILCLPIYPNLELSQIDFIINSILELSKTNLNK
jgi:dTDP-4-amino-4,6-dideoxygalactose transaminase